jgi:hypothetical protein
MSSVVISGDTSGAITLAAPAVAGTNTITLPAVTGTMLTTASTGCILQVVQTTTNTTASTTSATYVTTGLARAITPSSASNKVLITATFPTDGGSGAFTIYRGATALACDTFWAKATGASSTTSITFLDSPATTSSTTYTLYFKATSGTLYFIASSGTAYYGSITLMEVAG